MPDQIPMPREVFNHLADREMIGRKIDGFTVKAILGAGNTAITYEVTDQVGAPAALKLVTRESYGNRAPFREIARFVRAEDRRFLVFPEEIGDWSLPHGKTPVEFIWFKSRCVRGESLEAFLKAARFSAHSEVRRFIENIAVALAELGKIGFAHGDLHGRNIMREVIGAGGPVPDVRYVVIDFSEAHPLEDTNEGLLEDLQIFGQHLRSFADALYRRDDLSREDEKVLQALEHLPGLLNGLSAETVRLWNPTEILKTFLDGLKAAEDAPRKLRTPFDSLSTENITNDALLTKLCFTSDWWTAELVKQGNVLLIGPRGCGKSMVFRRHRMKTKIAAKLKSELKADPYIGFYIPCESVFFNRISDLSDSLVERYADALLLFFNMAVTSEFASTLALLPEPLGPVTHGAAEAVRKLLEDELGDLSALIGFRPAVLDINEVADRADTVMRWIRRKIAYGDAIATRGSRDYVTRLVQTLKSQVPSLSGRLFIVFLDDYTQERVPLALQRNLHAIVCQRSGDLCFKISAHMFGSMYSYPQPLPFDEGRNINVINLGSEYLNQKKKRVEREALIHIMNTRFAECEEYEGRLEGWLGHSVYPQGQSLNRALYSAATRPAVKYNGIECLQQLCTGDISEMIRMIRDIFNAGQVTDGRTVRLIAPAMQDKAIRGISRAFLARVRHIRTDGQKLFEILNAFGTLSKQLLYNKPLVGQGRNTRGQQRTDPYDLLTIYVDDLTKAYPEARRTWERLQQASIFIDIMLAPSQRAVIADRATLRRIYCPAFATTLTSSEHLQLTKRQFELFMDKPEEFCTEYLRNNTWISALPTLFEVDRPEEKAVEPIMPTDAKLPSRKYRRDFSAQAPALFVKTTEALPPLQRLESALARGSHFDLFIGAMGFEERTHEGAAALVRHGVTVSQSFLLEFDMYYRATEPRRKVYEQVALDLGKGRPFRPINAPVSVRDPMFAERLKDALRSVSGAGRLSILFDLTSCPALVLSRCLSVLLDLDCDLTVLYSEASEYYPTKEEWESGKLRLKGGIVAGPFSGVRYVEQPALLQADDTGERPILLVLFPTFNTERTSGVLSELGPVKQVWLFGEPHDTERNAHRVQMAQRFAAPLVSPVDEWSVVSTFDYRKSIHVLGGIYARERFNFRTVVMPHGSKMQTLGVNLFAVAHQISMAFAVPQNYDPSRYSTGCVAVWAVPLGSTAELCETLKQGRAVAHSPSANNSN